jgi:hypothetical protein
MVVRGWELVLASRAAVPRLSSRNDITLKKGDGSFHHILVVLFIYAIDECLHKLALIGHCLDKSTILFGREIPSQLGSSGLEMRHYTTNTT